MAGAVVLVAFSIRPGLLMFSDGNDDGRPTETDTQAINSRRSAQPQICEQMASRNPKQYLETRCSVQQAPDDMGTLAA
jgi:hypothetical protein